MIFKAKNIFLLHPEVVILSISTLVALLYFSWGINSWKFSFVGDEWAFYELAKNIAHKNFLVNPFTFNGVYLQNSILSSTYQALFLKILGDTNFAWRISNIILIIPITLFFFLWIKKSFNTQIALISTLILQSSFYLANFLKIGKNMPQAFTLFIICLYLASISGTYQQKKTVFFLGVTLGISFYVYIGPLFPLFIFPYLLPLLKNQYKKIFVYFFLLLMPYLVFISPALLDIAHWNGPASKTTLAREYSNNSQVIINSFQNFLLFYLNKESSHFVSGPYLDSISRILAFVGMLIILYNLKKNNYLYLLLVYLITIVVLGISTPYSYTPITRGIFFLPFGFAFAGLALHELSKKFSNKKFFVLTTLLFVFLFNIYQSQIGVFKESGYTSTALIIKLLQEVKANSLNRQVILFLSNENGYNYQNIFIMKEAYGLENVRFEVIKGEKLECSKIKETNLIFFQNDIDTATTVSNLACSPQDNFSINKLNPSIPL